MVELVHGRFGKQLASGDLALPFRECQRPLAASAFGAAPQLPLTTVLDRVEVGGRQVVGLDSRYSYEQPHKTTRYYSPKKVFSTIWMLVIIPRLMN